MLTIDRLRLSLPEGFEGRADRIARLVADELARLTLHQDARIDRLVVPPLPVGPNATDRQVASAIAGGVATQLSGETR